MGFPEEKYERVKPGETHRPPGKRMALLAVLVYLGLIAVVRNASGEFLPVHGISELDRRLYFHYLNIIAFSQHSMAVRWVTACLSTITTECLILGLMLWKHAFPRVVKAGCIANLATHPAFWYLLSGIGSNYAFWVVFFELIIAGVESLVIFAMLRELRLRDALFVSLTANGASFLLGLAKGIC